MTTFWISLVVPFKTEFTWVDAFLTGQNLRGSTKSVCFAIRGESQAEVLNLVAERVQIPELFVRFIEEKDWKIYRDFAGPYPKRFLMDEKYLDEEIDTVETIRKRI